MNAAEWAGTLGVSLLLLAFALNLADKLPVTSRSYLLLNCVGSLMAGVSSYMISFWPFVVLEGVWFFSSLMMLFNRRQNA